MVVQIHEHGSILSRTGTIKGLRHQINFDVITNKADQLFTEQNINLKMIT